MATIVDLDAPQNRYAKTIFYALPGAGKTTLCGSVVNDKRTYPCLWLDVAGNPQSLLIYEKRPFIVRIEELEDINKWYKFLKTGQPEKDPIVKEYGLTEPFKSIVFDGGTEVARMAKDKYSSEKDDLSKVPTKLEFDDHGAILRYMTKFARLFLKPEMLPEMHVFMTLLERRIKKLSGVEIYRPGLTGQAVDEVPGYALAMGHLVSASKAGGDAGKAKHSVLFFNSTAKRDAKWQYGVNPGKLEDPTISRILDLMEAK